MTDRTILASDLLASFPAIAEEYRATDLWLSNPDDVSGMGAYVRSLWADFARWNVATANALRTILDVLVDHDDPYLNADAQSADIRRGTFWVSCANSEHPVWSPDENVAFRIVHDILGHHASGNGFDRVGECETFVHSLAIVPPAFHPCLFVESIAQLAVLVYSGEFPAQKVYVSELWPVIRGRFA